MKSIPRLFISIIALAIFAGYSSAVSHAASIHFDSGKRALKIPFELHNNQVYLKVSINGSKASWVVLDTGARTIISRNAAQRFGLALQELGQVRSTGETGTFSLASTKVVSFKLPGVSFTAENVSALLFEDLEKCLSHSADAIIGFELFDNSVVEIDYKARLINIYDSKSYNYSGKGESFPLETFGGGLVKLHAEVSSSGDPPIPGTFMVDTGLTLSLFLNTPFVERNKLLAGAKGQDFTVCGFGESKALKAQVGALRLGSFKFNNPTTIFSQATSGIHAAGDVDGLVGGELLSHFKVIFDYSRKRMILESFPQT